MEMIDAELEQKLRAMADKQDIHEVIARYARGLDRGDADLVRSAFHDDAVDCHGPFSKTVSDFVENVMPELDKRQAQQTFLMNQLIDLDGDRAHVETYFVIARKFPGDGYLEQTAGRFIDRMEKREGAWKIALRVVIADWYMRADAAGFDDVVNRYHHGRRDRTDASYERPLRPREPVPSRFEVPWQYPAESIGGPVNG